MGEPILYDMGLDNEDLDIIAAEDIAQIEEWGYQEHSASKWMLILSEEVGELSKALLENKLKEAGCEAAQVATVALKIAVMCRRQQRVMKWAQDSVKRLGGSIIKTTQIVTDGEDAITAKSPKGTLLQASKVGLWRLANDDEQVLGEIHVPLDDQGWVQILLYSSVIMVKGETDENENH